MSRAYLDWNATAPLRPEVAQATVDALATLGNPSSVHGEGRAARRRIEEAREQVAALAGAEPAMVVFTGGGTEANALALSAVPGPVLVSAVEHVSVLDAAAALPESEIVPVTGDGRIDLDRLSARLAGTPRPGLLSLMLANNETGTLQPVAEAARLARAAGVRVHCDAIQAAGRIPVDVAALGVDLLTLSAHKLGGPAGVGALVVATDLPVRPLLRGGGQERGWRAGTENVAGIAGFGVAAAAAAAEAAGDSAARMATLRDGLEARLRAIAPDLRVHGEMTPRLSNTTCIGMPGVPAETQVMAFDLAGIAVSAGAACSSGKVRASHVLAATGADAAASGEAIRVSLGRSTTAAEVDRLAEAWAALYRRTRGRARLDAAREDVRKEEPELAWPSPRR